MGINYGKCETFLEFDPNIEQNIRIFQPLLVSLA